MKVFSFRKMIEVANERSLNEIINSLASNGGWVKKVEGQTELWLKENGYEHFAELKQCFVEKGIK